MASSASKPKTTVYTRGYAAALTGAVAALGLLLWADQALPLAGFWALLLLSASVGFLHGALDAVLLPQQIKNRTHLLALLSAYLLVVVLLGWALSAAVSVALWVLLLMSAWHFGEPFGRWGGVNVLRTTLTRTVVGGAPVMLPVWLASSELAEVLQGVVPAVGLQGWQVLAGTWLVLLLVWLPVCGVAYARVMRYAWCELLAAVLLYLVFSPLMAFAIYFGVYHAPVHIWRVWCSLRHSVKKQASERFVITAVLLTLVATWVLGAGLWWFLSSSGNVVTDWNVALRWLIIAFAALTAPHLVLISWCAAFLTQRGVI